MNSVDAPSTRSRRNVQPGTARAALSYRVFRIFFFANALSNVAWWTDLARLGPDAFLVE